MATESATSASGTKAGKATGNRAAKAPTGTAVSSPVASGQTANLTAGFQKGVKLGPVKGRGRRPDPVPAELASDLQASLDSCNGQAGEMGDKITRVVNQSAKTKLTNDIKKWKANQEEKGVLVQIQYRTNPDDKITKDHAGPLDFAVVLLAVRS